MRICLLIFICSISVRGFGQVSSNEIWLSSSTSQKIASDLQVMLEEGIRFSNGFVDVTYTDLSLRYRFSKYLRSTFTWRNAYPGGFWDAEHFDNRFQIDMQGMFDLKPVELNVRLRYQSRYRDWLTSEDGTVPTNRLRMKYGIGYKLSKSFKLQFGAENYLAFRSSSNFLDTYRLYVGAQYGFRDYHKIGVNYIFQSEIQVSSPNSAHIVSIGYSYDLTDKLKDVRKSKSKLKEEDKINWYILPN